LDKDDKKNRKLDANAAQGFLDVGSVSWSLLIAGYFLSLHKAGNPGDGAPLENDISDTRFCIAFESILEMLDVLNEEFSGMVPIETNPAFLGA
jgi:hypothetical protein